MISNKYTAPVSVIIPTYNRKEALRDVINDLAQQTYRPEITYIIDASEQHLRTKINNIPHDLSIKLISYENEPNVSKQRNLALKEVRTPWILFLDDDVRFSEDLVHTYMTIADSLKVDAINGLIKLRKYDKYYTIPASKDRLHSVGAENLQGSEKICETHVICTANFFARTQSIKNIGGFDEQLFGTIDDVDLGIRLQENGYRIIHHPQPEVLHLQIRESGARAFGIEWALTNLFYFQYRHFENPNSPALLFSTLWYMCRPSRDWLNPKLTINKIQAIMLGNKYARERIKEGPVLFQE